MGVIMLWEGVGYGWGERREGNKKREGRDAIAQVHLILTSAARLVTGDWVAGLAGWGSGCGFEGKSGKKLDARGWADARTNR